MSASDNKAAQNAFSDCHKTNDTNTHCRDRIWKEKRSGRMERKRKSSVGRQRAVQYIHRWGAMCTRDATHSKTNLMLVLIQWPISQIAFSLWRNETKTVFFRVFVSEWVRWIMVPATENISLSHFGEQVRVHRIHTQKAQTINYIVHSVFYTLSYFSSFQPRKELTEYRMPMPTVCHLGE